MKELGQQRRPEPDETYLGDVETAKKLADARRAARPTNPPADAPAQSANLRQQVVALLESTDMQELLKWAHEGNRIPWTMRRRAYQVEARRKSILSKLKAGGA